MTDLDGLLRFILEHPDDDGARLAYSDLLEEAGQAERAEFIRVQCELAKIPGVCPGCGRGGEGTVLDICCGRCEDEGALRRRERELLQGTGANSLGMNYAAEWWFKSLGIDTESHGFDFFFRRGFVERIVCTAADWLGGRCPKRACRGGVIMTNAIGTRTCPVCRGKGAVAGHADAILAALPVAEVGLTTWPDLEYCGEPFRGDSRVRIRGRSQTVCLGWAHQDGDPSALRHLVPRLLVKEFPSVRRWRTPDGEFLRDLALDEPELVRRAEMNAAQEPTPPEAWDGIPF